MNIILEPHAALLRIPPNGQSLYKVMTAENLLRSIADSYLYFHRVDRYHDSNADLDDGRQLLQDRKRNLETKFEQNPNLTAADYYDASRSKTYACCFSLENTNYIWRNYATNNKLGKICIEFDFEKMRNMIKENCRSKNIIHEFNEIQQNFPTLLNYGIIEYVDSKLHQISLKNPIKNTYMKDKYYSEEKEFRISLWLHMAPSLLPSNLSLNFDWKIAIREKVIKIILLDKNCDFVSLYKEFNNLGIEYQIIE